MRVCTRMRAHECTFHRFGSQSCLWKLVILQVFSLLFFFFFLKSLLGLKPVSYTSLLYQSVDHCFLYRTQAENPRQFPSVSSLNTHENQEGQAKKRNPGKKKRKKKRPGLHHLSWQSTRESKWQCLYRNPFNGPGEVLCREGLTAGGVFKARGIGDYKSLYAITTT